METPITTKTGIKMGSRYLENGNTMPVEDPDMLLLQEALLSTPQYRKQKRIERLVVLLGIGILLFVFFYNFLFR
jgi:hypothetical protein